MRYELRTFGGWRLLGPEGDRIDAIQAHSKGGALLSVLATRPHREPVDRDELVALLWPEAPEDRGRKTLRVTLTRLREDLPEGALGGKGEHRIWLEPSVVESDVRAFEEAVKEERLREALEHYRGPFLEHVHLTDVPSFNRWAEDRRQAYRREAYEAALKLGERAREKGEAAEAEEAYRRALDMEPLQEKAAARLMRALAAQGDRADALKLYRSFRNRVEEELNLAPSDDLEELAEQVRSGSGQAAGPEGEELDRTPPELESGGEHETVFEAWGTSRRTLVAALGLIALAGAAIWAGTWIERSSGGDAPRPNAFAVSPTVAVLPFDNIASDSGNAFFARGIHNEMLNQLSTVAGLTVKSRTSVLQYQNTEKTVTEISRELGGVDVILEGSVRRAGDQIRITAQLSDPREHAQLWAKTYKRKLNPEAIFEIQAEIASRIADAVAAELTPEERSRIETPPTRSLDAYDAYLKGRYHVAKYHEENASFAHVDSAIGFLRRAVRRDTAFAPAHAMLAIAYGPVYVATRDPQWRDSALSAARRAKRIDPDLAEAHIALGFVHWRVGVREKGHFQAAIRHLERATELQPSSALAAGLLAVAHDWVNNDVETLRWAHRASRLAPQNPIWPQTVSLVFRRVGMLGPAEAWARRAVADGPDHWRAVRALSLIQAEQIGPGAALDTLRRFREKHPRHAQALEVAAGLHLEAGRYDSARALYRRTREARRTEHEGTTTPVPEAVELGVEPQARLGYALIELGDTARGRRLLEKALATRRSRERPPNNRNLAGRAEASAALGNVEEAYRFLERALEKGYYGELDSPLLESLQGSRRFERLRSQALENQRAMQRRFRDLDIQLVPDRSVARIGG